MSRKKVLLGNAFPMTLVRGRAVLVREIPVDELSAEAAAGEVCSFWGHENTRVAAERVLGVGLKTMTARPAIALDAQGLPSLDGTSFARCFVLSPEYRAGWRPAVGQEVGVDAVLSWHALELRWLERGADIGEYPLR